MSNQVSVNKKSAENFCTLEEMPENHQAYVVEAPNHKLLAPLGIRKNKKIEVKSKQPFNGPIVIEIEGRQVAVDRDIANKIYIDNRKNIHATG
ncbi:FeoA family protein [Halarsenatibacter silvermanii]|uniref:Ferrous iron transport protein A n=1 Tax=Halarsenatibacter silvermanii TaxID=321763 RepID=A0A1G9S706_9FIRM|nr:FeoA family protein [Halarsenatibacter silvermanii]SDM31268.1 ferrous iron transport protein A [Halarsenatibacter silvermanii]